MTLIQLLIVQIATVCFIVTNHCFLVLAAANTNNEEAIVFPNGANSLFIGHSFFIPVAKLFAKVGNNKLYPNHNVRTFFQGGNKGSPNYLWENHKDDIDSVLNSMDSSLDLFGMTIANADTNLSNAQIVKGYQNWIDFVLSYHSETSFFIGVPWADVPSGYSTADAYSKQIQQYSDRIYTNVITVLRKLYPNTTIFYLNYGSIAGEMRILLEQNDLVGVTNMIGSSGDSIFVDNKGHSGSMLLDLAGFVWSHWLYGTPFNEHADNSWDQKTVIDIFNLTLQANKDYQLFKTTNGFNTNDNESPNNSIDSNESVDDSSDSKTVGEFDKKANVSSSSSLYLPFQFATHIFITALCIEMTC